MWGVRVAARAAGGTALGATARPGASSPRYQRCGGSAVAQRGAVAVEAALVVPLVVTVLLGVIELASLLHGQVGLAAAARSAARVGSSEPRLAGFADDAVAAALSSGTGVALSDIDEVWVYRANSRGFPGAEQATGFPAQCPSECLRYRPEGTGAVVFDGAWAAEQIDACVGTADALGVRIVATHRALSAGLIPATRLSEHAVMRFEPSVRADQPCR